jgi:hypothetical protein
MFGPPMHMDGSTSYKHRRRGPEAIVVVGRPPADSPGVSGAKTRTNHLQEGDTVVVTTLDRLGRSTQNMLSFAEGRPFGC